MNKVTREILKKISERKTLDSIAKELDLVGSALKARVDSFVYTGYIAEITYGGGCKFCPMSCSSNSCVSEIKMYSLTEKGKRLIGRI